MESEELQDKFIALVDILGYKNLQQCSLEGTGMSEKELAELPQLLCAPDDKDKYKIAGPHVCPWSECSSQDLAFQATIQNTDCCILSVEISPAGIINLIDHCSILILRLLKRGVLCRGSIMRGPIRHTALLCEGAGVDDIKASEKLVSAFKHDDQEIGTPFVEIHRSVSHYVMVQQDPCVKKMYQTFVKSDGMVTAIFPFRRILNAMAQSGSLQENRESIRQVRKWIAMLRHGVQRHMSPSDLRARQKSMHYLSILDDQLRLCNETETLLDDSTTSFPSLSMYDIWKPER